jgi:hypothetical protein
LSRSSGTSPNPGLLADIVTQTFLREPIWQQRLLGKPSVSQRPRLLIRYLQPG